MAEKQPEFVISDRRRFSDEGELRPDAKVAEEKPATPPAAKPAPPNQAAPPPAETAAQPPDAAREEAAQSPELSPPPTAEEEQQQHDAYKASTQKIDDMIAAAGKAGQGPMEMTFERVVESFYMSALIQMGAIRGEGEPQRIDIIGARQTIDSLAILQEKTKGNLTDREKTLMQNVLFELRMAWIEITNAVASSAAKPGAAPPTEKK
jgi:uncharacterized protein DUF1844